MITWVDEVRGIGSNRENSSDDKREMMHTSKINNKKVSGSV